MKKALIPTAILCTAICIGVHTQPQETEQPTATPAPQEIEITIPEIEEPIIKAVTPEPILEPVIQQPVVDQTVQAGDMVYVPPALVGSRAKVQVR